VSGDPQSAFDREEKALEDRYARGEITNAELTKELNELARDYREAAQEAAQDAAAQEIDRW